MKILIRIPVAKVGSIAHKKKKGKGSYTRKTKHKRQYKPLMLFL